MNQTTLIPIPSIYTQKHLINKDVKPIIIQMSEQTGTHIQSSCFQKHIEILNT